MNEYLVLYDEITENTTLTTHSFVYKPLTINSGATLTINQGKRVKFAPGAGIIIKPGGKLIVNKNVTLTNSCSYQMWQGIVVEGNSSASQSATNQGTIELKEGAVIEKAITAISTCSGGKAGGVITATNATFRNNQTAVKIYPYSYSVNGEVYPHQGSFIRCNFILDENNLLSANGLSFSEHVSLSGINRMILL